MSFSTDDEGLMEELARAVAQTEAVPDHRRNAARAAFTWRTIDEELLALTHDSLELADAAVRGALDVRTLGFESDGLSLEIEVDGDRVFGQVLDAEVDEVVVESTDSGSQTCAGRRLGRLLRGRARGAGAVRGAGRRRAAAHAVDRAGARALTARAAAVAAVEREGARTVLGPSALGDRPGAALSVSRPSTVVRARCALPVRPGHRRPRSVPATNGAENDVPLHRADSCAKFRSSPRSGLSWQM